MSNVEDDHVVWVKKPIEVPPIEVPQIRSQDVITAASLTYRQLDYWTRKGYIHARRHSYGSGNPRDYSDEEMAVAVRMARLVQAGFNPLAASKIARTESGVIKLKPGITLRVEWLEGSR